MSNKAVMQQGSNAAVTRQSGIGGASPYSAAERPQCVPSAVEVH
jgi:hypothetical protein